jgi:hypothetical protein
MERGRTPSEQKPGDHHDKQPGRDEEREQDLDPDSQRQLQWSVQVDLCHIGLPQKKFALVVSLPDQLVYRSRVRNG